MAEQGGIAISNPYPDMNLAEVVDFIEAKDVKRFSSLVNQFRADPNVGELMVLLNSDDERIVEVGVYIASEISVDKSDAPPMVVRLRELINHPNWSIRFHAMGALYEFLDPADPVTKEMYAKLSQDSAKSVRSRAEAGMKRLGLQ